VDKKICIGKNVDESPDLREEVGVFYGSETTDKIAYKQAVWRKVVTGQLKELPRGQMDRDG